MLDTTSDRPIEQERSRADRDELVLNHMHLVKAIAQRLHVGLPKSVDISDLQQAGVLGLLGAATKYDSFADTEFGLYARHRIKGAMLDSLRQSDNVSRGLRKREKQITKTVQQLTGELKREPMEQEIAEKLDIDLAELRESLTTLRNAKVVSVSTARNDEDMPIDVPGSPTGSPQFIYAQKECRTLVSAAIQQLPERHRSVIGHLFYEGRRGKEVSIALGIHETRVTQLRKSALKMLGNSLRPQGVYSSRVI